MAKKTTGVTGGDSEAVRIFERMEEETAAEGSGQRGSK